MTFLSSFGLILLLPFMQDGVASKPPIGPVLSSTTKKGEQADPKPANNPGQWVTAADYPASALREGAEGVTRFKLEISENGNIAGCSIVKSSGYADLDAATCKNVTERAEFSPATNQRGQAIAGTYQMSVRWQIPEGSSAPFPIRSGTTRASFIVEPDGTYSECSMETDGKLLEIVGPGSSACPPFDGIPPFVDENGVAVRKRVVMTNVIVIEDVEPVEDAE